MPIKVEIGPGKGLKGQVFKIFNTLVFSLETSTSYAMIPAIK
jgi:hypothetical protein